MTSRITLSILALTVVVGASCKRGEETTPTSDAPQATSAAAEVPAPAPSAAQAAVASYPNMIQQGGTVTLTQALKVHQAADPNSPVLTRLGPGTAVERKGSVGEWMLINWPSGVGQLSPGWVLAAFLGPAAVVVPDAGAPDSGVKDSGAPDTGAPATSKIPRPNTREPTPTTPTGTPGTKRPTFKVSK
jgi:hypothetical protein